ADRNPLARRRLGLLDVRRHRLPLARVLVEHDVTLRVHVEPTLAVHAVGLFDTLDVLRRRDETHDVGAAEDQRLAIAPALVHRPILLGSSTMVAIERSRSTERIANDIETLSGPDYTLSSEAIRRYAYTPVYRNPLDY